MAEGNSSGPRIPDWIYSPGAFIDRRITSYILGLIASAVAVLTGYLGDGISIVIDSFEAAAEPFTASSAVIASQLNAVTQSLAAVVFETAEGLGPLGPFFIVLVIAVTGLVAIRLVRVASDYLGLQALLGGT